MDWRETDERREKAAGFFYELQDSICSDLTRETGEDDSHEDAWERPGGGGGRSRIIQEGRVFEKAGVNVSRVYGDLPEGAIQAMAGGERNIRGPASFFATGLSLVLHPRNPHAPTVHANFRYFSVKQSAGSSEGEEHQDWFGGGADLTPSYLYAEDARHFHRVLKEACDPFGADLYARYKKWCDEYFFIRHRGESRGVGGIFFDNLNSGDFGRDLDFVKSCGNAFWPAYGPVLSRRVEMEFNEAQKVWQQIRRGRYVEFNLVYDRGTVFGLKTAGRVESILMSLPLTARWQYDHRVEPGSPEEALLEVLREPRDWLKT